MTDSAGITSEAAQHTPWCAKSGVPCNCGTDKRSESLTDLLNEEELANAMYACCIVPPQTEHAAHVLTRLRTNQLRRHG